MSNTLVAELPELGKLNRKQIAVLVGVVPVSQLRALLFVMP